MVMPSVRICRDCDSDDDLIFIGEDDFEEQYLCVKCRGQHDTSGEDIRDLLDTVHNCLIAAGGSTDIDKLEQQLFEAGAKPSEFVAYRITMHRRLLTRFTDLCDVHFMDNGPMDPAWKRLYDDTREFLGTAMRANGAETIETAIKRSKDFREWRRSEG